MWDALWAALALGHQQQSVQPVVVAHALRVVALRRLSLAVTFQIGDMAHWRGELLHIHVAPSASVPMQTLAETRLVAGVGVEGDRYATRRGTYSNKHHIDRQATLIEVETLEALARDHGVDLAPHEHRRNLTTRGVPLNHLVGGYFSIGECVLYGGRLNVPCRYLEELVGKKVFKPLLNRSGLNCRVVRGGLIRTGDAIAPCDPALLDAAARSANEAFPLERPPEAW